MADSGSAAIAAACDTDGAPSGIWGAFRAPHGGRGAWIGAGILGLSTVRCPEEATDDRVAAILGSTWAQPIDVEYADAEDEEGVTQIESREDDEKEAAERAVDFNRASRKSQ